MRLMARANARRVVPSAAERQSTAMLLTHSAGMSASKSAARTATRACMTSIIFATAAASVASPAAGLPPPLPLPPSGTELTSMSLIDRVGMGESSSKMAERCSQHCETMLRSSALKSTVIEKLARPSSLASSTRTERHQSVSSLASTFVSATPAATGSRLLPLPAWVDWSSRATARAICASTRAALDRTKASTSLASSLSPKDDPPLSSNTLPADIMARALLLLEPRLALSAARAAATSRSKTRARTASEVSISAAWSDDASAAQASSTAASASVRILPSKRVPPGRLSSPRRATATSRGHIEITFL
mmetsp:Transcript_7452/g.30293  ORF Transcript_7452/g.30293 Transcript_7452/m.30293 type:complete len:307 (-) Transcript_7452:978-1898(-)